MKNTKMETEKLVIVNASGKLVTTSIIIAKAFKKEHEDILINIKVLSCSKEFKILNFKLIKYWDSNRRIKKYYEISSAGLALITKEYEGEFYCETKEIFFREFNRKTEFLKNLGYPKFQPDSDSGLLEVEKDDGGQNENQKMQDDLLGDSKEAIITSKDSNRKDPNNLITSKAMADELDISLTSFNRMLKAHEIIYKYNRKWFPFKEFLNEGYVIKQKNYETSKSGKPVLKTEFYWTSKGRDFLLNKFNLVAPSYKFIGNNLSQFQSKLLNLALNGWKIQKEIRAGNEYLYAVKYIARKKQRIYLGSAKKD
jgi:Rha family phage regulatory protein